MTRGAAPCSKRLPKKADWQPGRSRATPWRSSVVTGRGLAYARYENENAYVAVVADVEVSERG